MTILKAGKEKIVRASSTASLVVRQLVTKYGCHCASLILLMLTSTRSLSVLPARSGRIVQTSAFQQLLLLEQLANLVLPLLVFLHAYCYNRFSPGLRA
jgi:hypothetical protein